jgi:hypothetical protein
MQASTGPMEKNILRFMQTAAPDSGCRAVCRLCEALWGQCGIVGWSARLMAQTYERRDPPSHHGVAAMREAIRRLEAAGRVVTFSYAGCQGELFAAPVSEDPAA